MRLKILILPFFLAMTLILSIWFIKPDFDQISEKKSTLTEKNKQVSEMDSVIANIQSLNSSLDKDPVAEKFILDYLPYTIGQDQVIDAFNYLAGQSGLIIAETTFSMAPKKEAVEEQSTISYTGGVATLVVVKAPEVKSFIFSGSVYGSYENIKNFFDQMSHIGRFQNIHSFVIQQEQQPSSQTGKGNTASSNGVLKGTLVAEFGYLPKQTGTSALDGTTFHNSNIDFVKVKKIKDLVTTLPTLETGQSGKPNPFQ